MESLGEVLVEKNYFIPIQGREQEDIMELVRKLMGSIFAAITYNKLFDLEEDRVTVIYRFKL